MKKKIIFKFTYYSSTLSLRIPSIISFFSPFFIFVFWHSNENESFQMIFAMKDKLESILNERVIKYENEIYIKHHLRK